MERKPVITAASVAQGFFRKELDAHDSQGTLSKVVVIIRDSCYGHRYSRPRTSKAALSTIVERPERLHACILGASTAYVRIGGRHAGGRFPPHPSQDVQPPPFKIRKTTRSIPLNYSAVTQVHGQKRMDELQIMCDSAEGKLAMNGRELVRPIGYGKDEAGNPLPKLHEGDLYLCSDSLDALQGCLGGVCDAVDTVFDPGAIRRAFVCIRPPGHHCSSDFPSGFCWLNNVHVGIAHAAMTQGLTHAAIIDFDLHHGDGSQAIAWDHNRKAAGTLPKNASPYSKTPIGYFSLHDINSYPCEWGDEEKIKNASLCVEAAHGQSIWNVHLEPWKNHTDFWRLYESRYSILLEKTRLFLRQHTSKLESASNGTKAKAAIFLSAGFDASEWEGPGMQRHKVNVPTDFYARFTSDVVQLAEEEGLGVDGRIISVLEGGYSDRALTSGVISHLCGLACDSGHAGLSVDNGDKGLAFDMAEKMSTLSMNGHTSRVSVIDPVAQRDSKTEVSYSSEWWNSLNLEAIEELTNPAPVHSTEAKLKDKSAGNYSSPTQASTAKMTDPARERRSLSGQAEGRSSMEPEPLQPPPDVDWAIASYELSRLLIPNDRQTLSCRHDELNAEATKVRRERQSGIGLPSNDLSAVEQRMQLRDRKTKAALPEEMVKGSSKADRRRTIAAVADLPDPSSLQNVADKGPVGIASSRPRRRSSAGSSILASFESMNLNDHGSQSSEAVVVTGRDNIMFNDEKDRALKFPTKTNKIPVQRKVKQPTAVKSQPAKARSSPRRTGQTPPVPKVPPTFRKFSNETSTERETAVIPPNLALDTGESMNQTDNKNDNKTDNKTEDVDVLSSGFKKMKINLKVPSPEENLARERKKAEERDMQKKARAPRKPAVPKVANFGIKKVALPTSTPVIREVGGQKAMPVDFISPIVQPEQLPPSTNVTAKPAITNDSLQIADMAHAEAPPQATVPALVPPPVEVDHQGSVGSAMGDLPSSEVQPTFTTTMPITSGPASPLPDDFFNLSESPPSGAPAPAPALAPTTVKKSKADLPQFTASSPIPFARQGTNSPFATLPRDNALNAADSGIHPDPGLGDKTADSTSTIRPDLQQQDQKHEDTAGNENNHPQVQHPSSTTADSSNDPSIWEVPETPRH